MTRALVIGLDSVEPSLVFERWRDELPTLSALARDGLWGRVATTVPPITCPAWPASLTGLNPGHLGLYDLKYRVPGTYTRFGIVSSRLVRKPRVWDYLTRSGKRSISLFVPVTYPPSQIEGLMVAGFLTPNVRSDFTHPPQLKQELLSVVGGPENYIIDVYDYRRIPPRQLYEQLRAKTAHDFKIIRHFLAKERWDFFMTVIMSIDRAQHTLWKFFDREHPRYVEDPELAEGLLDLHRQIDEELAKTLELVPPDTAIIIISDHGAKRMYHRINTNELLAQEGLLRLREMPDRPMGLPELDQKGLIDWERTVAYALGAYIAQVFINVRGRDPKGVVAPGEEYLAVREQVAEVLASVKGPDGEKLDNRVFMREDAYEGEKLDLMPDLTVYYDNLHYGSNEAVGFGSLYSLETAKGPDDSNHGEFGMFILKDPEERVSGRAEGLRIEDLCPTVLELLGLPVPPGLTGKSVLEGLKGA